MLIEIGDHFGPLLGVNFSQMNISQLHERLRLELLRRIKRGSVSVSLLARQTGFGQSHLSNFLHNRRQLSLEAMDRILSVQHLAVSDLLPESQKFERSLEEDQAGNIPLVSHHAALNDRIIRPSAILAMLDVPSAAFRTMRVRASSSRRTWQRFVAVRVPADDAIPMDPLLFPDALAVIDRHYTSFAPYRPDRATLYAVRNKGQLKVRYAEFISNRLVLRPHNIEFPVELIDIEPGQSPSDHITGRVAMVLNET